MFLSSSKRGGESKFRFVRYDTDQDAQRAIQMFNGLKLEGGYLAVKKARFQWSRGEVQVTSDERVTFSICCT